MIHITVQQVTDDILKYKRRLFCPPTEYVVVTKPFIQVQKTPAGLHPPKEMLPVLRRSKR